MTVDIATRLAPVPRPVTAPPVPRPPAEPDTTITTVATIAYEIAPAEQPDRLAIGMYGSAGLGVSLILISTGVLEATGWAMQTRTGQLVFMLLILGATMVPCGLMYGALSSGAPEGEK